MTRHSARATRKPKVRCPECGKLHTLAGNGYIHPHGPRGQPYCLGSWTRPTGTLDAMQTPPEV